MKADESRIAGALEWPLTLLDECQQYARWDSDVTVKVAQIVALFEEMTIGVHVTESQSGRFQPPISRGENTSLRQDFCLLAWEEPSLVAGARQCALSENAVDEELASFKVGCLAQSSKMLMTCEVKKPQKMMHVSLLATAWHPRLILVVLVEWSPDRPSNVSDL